MKKKWFIGLLILIITLIWGYAWVLMKLSLDFMGPFTFSAFRFATGSAVLLAIVVWMKAGMPQKGHWKHYLIVGLLQTTFVFLLIMYGLRFVDAGKSSVLLYSMPIWSSLFAAIILREKISTTKVVGLGLGMVGLLTILGWDIWVSQNLQAVFGELLIVLAAVAWGASNVYYRLKIEKAPKLQASAYQMLFGTIGIAIAALVMEWGEPINIAPVSIYYILFTGVLASALCFTLWFFILSMIDMVTATLPTLLVPVFGLLFGWLILDEQMTVSIMIGSMLILGGILVAQVVKVEKH